MSYNNRSFCYYRPPHPPPGGVGGEKYDIEQTGYDKNYENCIYVIIRELYS